MNSYRIYTLLNSQRFYFNRNNDTFNIPPMSYEYEGDDLLTCNLFEAEMKLTEMREVLFNTGIGVFELNLFYELLSTN